MNSTFGRIISDRALRHVDVEVPRRVERHLHRLWPCPRALTRYITNVGVGVSITGWARLRGRASAVRTSAMTLVGA